MNARKFLVLFAIVTVLIMMIGSVSFAKTKSSSKKTKDVATVEVWADSGDTAKATSGDVKEAAPSEAPESGEAKEEAKATSGDEKVEATSGDEKVEATSGDEKVEATSGDKKEESGDKVIEVADVKEDDWYKPYVEKVLKADIMKLDAENKFYPNEAATTKEVLEAISIAKDVSYSVEANNEEQLLNKKITREESAYVIYQYAKSVGKGFEGEWMFNLEFADKAEISEEAFEAVAWCNMNKIIIGREDKILAPKELTTRAELATMVTRLVDNVK